MGEMTDKMHTCELEKHVYTHSHKKHTGNNGVKKKKMLIQHDSEEERRIG